MKRKKNNEIRRCLCPCNRELPSQYKGRLKMFATPECRKVWKSVNPNINAYDTIKN